MGKKILLATDDETKDHLYAQILCEKGYDVIIRDNPEIISGALGDEDVGLVVSDLTGDFNGFEILEEAKKRRGDEFPVIFHSAFPRYFKEVMASAAEYCVVRDFKGRGLVDAVEKVFAGKE